jgi:AAA domain
MAVKTSRRAVQQLFAALRPTLFEEPRKASTVFVSQQRLQPVLPAMIEYLEITNFRAVEDLRLRFDKPWKVFLGENATGKTTVLEAVTWALMGEKYVTARKAQGKNWLTRKGGRRVPEGCIRVQLSGDDKPIAVRFTKDKIEFLSGAEGAGTFVRAYGIVRLTRPLRKGQQPPVMQADNLFDPHTALVDPNNWMAHLEEEQQRPLKIALRDLLQLETQHELQSTIDPSLNRDFDRYYAILAKPQRTDQEEREYHELKKKLTHLNGLAYTRRDQLLYELIDELLARETSVPSSTWEALKDNTRERISDMWRTLTEQETFEV